MAEESRLMNPRIVFLLILISGVVADLWTKSWAFERVPSAWSPRIELIPGFFYIGHAKNDGAMWSLFQGLPSWIWVALRGSVSALILGWYWTRPRLPFMAHVAFGLILAGALGNLHDNIFGDGRVRDFLLVWFGSWPFPMFNLADSMICVGAGLMLIALWKEEPRPASRVTA